MKHLSSFTTGLLISNTILKNRSIPYSIINVHAFVSLLQVSSAECNSSETPLISENEKTESATNVEDQGSISSDQAWDEYQVS